MDKKDILIIDDDKDLGMITSDVLQDHGYKVELAGSIEDAYEALEKNQFKLLILDINLPDGTGFNFCKEIRRESIIPIIFISARTSDSDKVTGLDLGGDDYLPKPYSLAELLSRVNANIRRAYGFVGIEEKVKFDNIEIDLTARIIKKEGKDIKLSIKEFDLLKYLLKHKNTTLRKENIFSEVWGMFNEIEISTLAVHIRWLREKLEDNPSKPKYIKTLWGVGYIFEVGI
ncbi:response regulator transcription factor [Clostridium gasigenes]|uniref:response regulator transcription factor n=1 Tax=Clostridium gasigenes TaxID=94869 RepID=UPI001C0B3816|nr:response regulator transcription factor [Clostridium gasigenes]MBU3130882.1 response regulator transcription factor [Clostridium gasigenes]